MPSSLSQVPRVLAIVFRSRTLRRLELAFAGFNAAEWSVWIAMLVYAYGRGGTTEAGIVAVALLAPCALFAPVGAALGDRHRAGRVLFWSYVAQSLGLGVTAAVLLAGGSAVLAYACAGVAGVAVTVTRPTMSALVPSLVHTPEELTAVNVASSWTESVSLLVAPALAGVILGLSGPGAVFAVMSVAVAISALLVWTEPGPPVAGRVDESREGVRHALGGAFRVLRDERPARLLVILLCADFVALGALDVLYPGLAIGVLEQSDSWAGYLNAAFGAGATCAVLLTAGLVGRKRLMPTMLAGLGLYVASFCLLAAYPTVGSALLLLALAGAGRVVLDVGARTLLQRVAPSDVLARVFGLLEGLAMTGLAVGSLLVTLLVAVGGIRLGILGIGLLLPVAAIAAGRGLLEVDRHATVPVVQIGLLRSLPLFAPLQPATLELLARSLERVDLEAGEDVFRQGDVGDLFYVIADGNVEVVRDGLVVASLGRSDAFGEVALLTSVPRTATCTATVPATLFALDKADFLTALTGHARTRAEADRLAAARRPEAGATTTVR
jgi:MFS family permease